MTMQHPIIVSFPGAATNVAGALSLGNLPALVGSDKQVAWATDIRADCARAIAAMAAKAANKGVGIVTRNDAEFIATVESDIADALATTPTAARFVGSVDRLFARTDARYWIDNRAALPLALLRAHDGAVSA